jgi:hypothetical protein
MALKLICLPLLAARCGARLGFVFGLVAGASLVVGACAVATAAKGRKPAET